MIISSNIVLLKVLQQTTIAKRKSLKCGHYSKYKFSNSIQYYNLVFVFLWFLDHFTNIMISVICFKLRLKTSMFAAKKEIWRFVPNQHFWSIFSPKWSKQIFGIFSKCHFRHYVCSPIILPKVISQKLKKEVVLLTQTYFRILQQSNVQDTNHYVIK